MAQRMKLIAFKFGSEDIDNDRANSGMLKYLL